MLVDAARRSAMARAAAEAGTALPSWLDTATTAQAALDAVTDRALLRPNP